MGNRSGVGDNAFLAAMVRVCAGIWETLENVRWSAAGVIVGFLLKMLVVVAVVLAARRVLGMLVYEADGLRRACYFDFSQLLEEGGATAESDLRKRSGGINVNSPYYVRKVGLRALLALLNIDIHTVLPW